MGHREFGMGRSTNVFFLFIYGNKQLYQVVYGKNRKVGQIDQPAVAKPKGPDDDGAILNIKVKNIYSLLGLPKKPP